MRNLPSAAALGSVCLAFAGCAVGPDYVAPSRETPAEWQLADDPQLSTAAAVADEWWKTFNDPALDAVVERAPAST